MTCCSLKNCGSAIPISIHSGKQSQWDLLNNKKVPEIDSQNTFKYTVKSRQQYADSSDVYAIKLNGDRGHRDLSPELLIPDELPESP